MPSKVVHNQPTFFFSTAKNDLVENPYSFFNVSYTCYKYLDPLWLRAHPKWLSTHCDSKKNAKILLKALYRTWKLIVKSPETKVGGWQLKFINSWMSWSEHKTIFNLIYVNSFDKICTINIIYMSYRWKIGKNFAQKMIINTKTDKTSCQGYQKKRNQKWSNDYRFTYHPLRQL